MSHNDPFLSDGAENPSGSNQPQGEEIRSDVPEEATEDTEQGTKDAPEPNSKFEKIPLICSKSS